MLKQFVFTDKLVSYEYFMDELKDYELELLIEGHDNANKISWEQTRMLMYSILAPYQKKGKNIKTTDILSFPWDNEPTHTGDIEISNEQVDFMKRRIGAMQKKMVKDKQKENGRSKNNNNS